MVLSKTTNCSQLAEIQYNIITPFWVRSVAQIHTEANLDYVEAPGKINVWGRSDRFILL